MTRSAVDEGTPKYHMPLEDNTRMIETNIKVLGDCSLRPCGRRLSPKTVREVNHTPAFVEARLRRTKISSLKGRLGKVMHKLYDLEPKASAADKPLNIDFEVNLYQMESF